MKQLFLLIVFSLFNITMELHAIEKFNSWTPEAMMRMQNISDVQISPNCESVIYVATERVLTGEKGSLQSKIYKTSLVSNSGPVLLASGNAVMQLKWSPDGKLIAFLLTEENGKNLYLTPSTGGRSERLVYGDVQTFCWSPDSKKIAFVMNDKNEKEKKLEKTSLAYIYKKDRSVNRLWSVKAEYTSCWKSDPQPLTSDEYCVVGFGDFGTANAEFDWSPDSQKITFAYTPALGPDYYYLDRSLATINLNNNTITPLEKKVPYEAAPRYSPDGKWIAYLSSNSAKRYSLDRQVAIRSVDGLQHRLLNLTFNEGPLLSDPSLLGWTQNGKSLIFFEPKGTKYHLVLVPIDGGPVQEVHTGELFFKEPNLSYDRTMLGFVAQSPNTPPEAYIIKLEDLEPIQISSENSSLLTYPKITTEIVTWKSNDGTELEGLLTFPINYKNGKQYPLLTVIHGGPNAFFDETFLGTPHPYPLASFAQEGFMIFRPNPRGSSGYGKDFRCAIFNDWGGLDFNDIMSGIDALIAKGFADPVRLGVMGWSYGGYMTAWAITQTSQFKAASMGAGFCNLISMHGTTDLDRYLSDYLGNFPENREFYENRSPINYILNVTTPCLIQHGTDDKRVPVSQSYEFYHALTRNERKTELILYPGMAHRLSDPKMVLDAMERNLKWFKQHLLE